MHSPTRWIKNATARSQARCTTICCMWASSWLLCFWWSLLLVNNTSVLQSQNKRDTYTHTHTHLKIMNRRSSYIMVFVRLPLVSMTPSFPLWHWQKEKKFDIHACMKQSCLSRNRTIGIFFLRWKQRVYDLFPTRQSYPIIMIAGEGQLRSSSWGWPAHVLKKLAEQELSYWQDKLRTVTTDEEPMGLTASSNYLPAREQNVYDESRMWWLLFLLLAERGVEDDHIPCDT